MVQCEAPARRGGEDDPPALQVGDAVQLVSVPGHVKLPVGSRGTIMVDGLPWGMLTVVFGQDPERGKAYLLRRQHLRLVASTPSPAAPPAPASSTTGFWPGRVGAGSVAGSSGGNNPATGRPRPPEIAARAAVGMPAAAAAQPVGVPSSAPTGAAARGG